MSQPVGSVTSAPQPLEGQDHRSSPDFQFINLPESGNLTIQITGGGSSDVQATLMHEKGGWPDQNVGPVSNTATVSVDKVETGANYYIADPVNATQDFDVSFFS
jgi:hypothetical protein